MKNLLIAILTVMSAQIASAADIYCGANVETTPGSQIYNKLLFWEKVDLSKPNFYFLLKDGTLLSRDTLTPDQLAKVVNGSIVLSVSFSDQKPQLFAGKVKRNAKNEIGYTDVAIANSYQGVTPFLLANGVAMMCREL